MKMRPYSFTGAVLLLSFILLISGCTAQTEGTIVWIDVPVNNLRLAEAQTLHIEGHATSPGGITRVEVLVNGVLLATIQDPPGKGALASFETSWTPAGTGDFRIQAVAYGTDGSTSQADTAQVTIGGEAATEISAELSTPTFTPSVTATFTPTNTETPTATPPEETTIEFWADPPTITAGECTDLHWKVTTALKVIFGGTERPLEGWDSACTCEPQNYPLTVTFPDGHEEKVYVKVDVTGTCEAPADTTAPPVPTLMVPANGLSIACKPSQTLTWLPVTDPSGIGQYQVLVERSSDNVNWGAAPGSPIEGLSDKTTTVNTECGWYYRWRVRAIDTAGNASGWSNWFYFSITLS